jgi:hypothetical protein
MEFWNSNSNKKYRLLILPALPIPPHLTRKMYPRLFNSFDNTNLHPDLRHV